MSRRTEPYRVEYLPEGALMNRFLWHPVRPKDRIEPQPGVVYIDKAEKRAFFLCPCGEKPCVDYLVELNLDQELKRQDNTIPAWTFQDVGGIADISPSVWRRGNLSCHFFIRTTGVEWCG